jgi:aldehyde dehydrogenase (NAD+)
MASKVPYTPISEIAKKVEAVKKAFQTKTTIDLAWRKQQLRQLRACLSENWESFYDALKSDLHQIELVAKFEHNQCVSEIDYMLSHLDEWMQPRELEVPVVHLPAWGYSVREPYGVVLVIAPWNYPAQLSLLPAIGAIAGGNCVVIKPSEIAPAISKWMATNLPKYMDNERIVVIEGAVDETTELLAQRWDLIFYTGNPFVGKLVASAAAKFLTPTVLELGGKSPVIVDRTVNLDTVVKRIAFGKFTNCGQTCIAPDHVYVHKDVIDDFVTKMKKLLTDWYSEDAQQSKDYSRIVAERHVKRLDGLIKSVPAEHVVFGGKTVEADRYVQPTLILNPPVDSKVMQEEIFGPVLPILSYSDLSEVINIINNGEKPLALYLFTTDKASQKLVSQTTSSGSLVLNDTLSQGTCRGLPFGGIGNSGYGNYYGQFSFQTMTHEKAVFQKSTLPDPFIKFPPYSSTSVSIITSLLNVKLPKLSTVLGVVAGIGSLVVLAYAYKTGTLQKHIDIHFK